MQIPDMTLLMAALQHNVSIVFFKPYTCTVIIVSHSQTLDDLKNQKELEMHSVEHTLYHHQGPTGPLESGRTK